MTKTRLYWLSQPCTPHILLRRLIAAWDEPVAYASRIDGWLLPL